MDIIWYNVTLLPTGVRINGIDSCNGREFAYEDPRLLDYIKDAIHKHTRSW